MFFYRLFYCFRLRRNNFEQHNGLMAICASLGKRGIDSVIHYKALSIWRFALSTAELSNEAR